MLSNLGECFGWVVGGCDNSPPPSWVVSGHAFTEKLYNVEQPVGSSLARWLLLFSFGIVVLNALLVALIRLRLLHRNNATQQRRTRNETAHR